LNAIAIQLNSVIDLNQALQLALKQTVELMGLQTGWIWLVHPSSNSVFLAASYQLPPAFTQHPERLSGWCYCIDRYLADHLSDASNISEITCTRLKDLKEGTNGLRYHATIPLNNKETKLGLLNLVSEKTKQLSDGQLDTLHTIGNLLSTTIVRTRLFEQSKSAGVLEERARLSSYIKKGLFSDIERLIKVLEMSSDPSSMQQKEIRNLVDQIRITTNHTLSGLEDVTFHQNTKQELHYPMTPLTSRELEVLEEIKLGKTNKAIAQQLFISERTVKFHVSALLSKLDATNRTDAVQIAVKRGLIRFG